MVNKSEEGHIGVGKGRERKRLWVGVRMSRANVTTCPPRLTRTAGKWRRGVGSRTGVRSCVYCVLKGTGRNFTLRTPGLGSRALPSETYVWISQGSMKYRDVNERSKNSCH